MASEKTILIQGTEDLARGEMDNVTLDGGAVVLEQAEGRYLLFGCYTTPAFSVPVSGELLVSWNADTPEGIEAWRLQGSLFFGSVSKLSYMTDPKRITARNANKVVILNCTALMNIDNSAMDIISTYMRALKRRNFELIICGATGHTLHQLERTGIAQALGKNMVDTMFDAERLARELLRSIP